MQLTSANSSKTNKNKRGRGYCWLKGVSVLSVAGVKARGFLFRFQRCKFSLSIDTSLPPFIWQNKKSSWNKPYASRKRNFCDKQFAWREYVKTTSVASLLLRFVIGKFPHWQNGSCLIEIKITPIYPNTSNDLKKIRIFLSISLNSLLYYSFSYSS